MEDSNTNRSLSPDQDLLIPTNYDDEIEDAAGNGTSRPALRPLSHNTTPLSQRQNSRGSQGLQESSTGESDDLKLLQAVVFLEDAANYRSIDHRVDKRSIQMYRLYFSSHIALLRHFVIFVLHILAFLEFPSSLTWTSDSRTRGNRINISCGVTESIEFVCLGLLLWDAFMKIYLHGWQSLRINKWLAVECVVLLVSYVDLFVSLGLGCSETVRVRRMLRPIFIIQNSSLMKKILNCLRKTLPQVVGVLVLMVLHIYVFTLFGMLLFSKPNTDDLPVDDWSGSPKERNSTSSERVYFKTLTESFMSLLVLLTTANNPDVTTPAYDKNRLYIIFFIIFLVIGLYCFMNMLTAIIYNQFRGYFLRSMQSSLLRRRQGERMAFEALKQRQSHGNLRRMEISEVLNVSLGDLKVVVSQANIDKNTKVAIMEAITESETVDDLVSWEDFLRILSVMEKEKKKKPKPQIRRFQNPHLLRLQKIFSHKYYTFFGNLMAFVNVILITAELATQYDKSLTSSKSALRIINFLFILYYVIEQVFIFVSLGWRRYAWYRSHIFDGIIVAILAVFEIITVGLYGLPFLSGKEVNGDLVLWNIVRVINVLIMIRLLRIIWYIKVMAIVANTLLDLIRNLQSFGGILIVIYYSFAILGIELFYGVIEYKPQNNTNVTNMPECGSYAQLEYWANNFDDFAAALVVLWDIMVVNNWHVFLEAYSAATTKWSYIYFIVWWLLSVVIVLNLFTALILENFIMKWDKLKIASRRRTRSGSTSAMLYSMTVHDMFRQSLAEPQEEDIMGHLRRHRFMNLSESTRY
ncbi:hypothetical protein CHS0354_025650 [Potamilus streckersoni]|uniref:Ion transport domain-containing protein n=1 Tax=Potamilus streckersoni TaxID=2493646 RepID=A0AAE0VME0_9BIVA|nr:hypothetical protein CHS0354_025650 [Potamilus streckersoni]